MRNLKIAAAAVITSMVLSACGGDDVDNDDVVAALESQNQVLQQTLEATQQSDTTVEQVNISVNGAPINLYGHIYNSTTKEKASQATISVRVANTWRNSIITTDGNFEINDLPAGSDYEILVSSESGEFMNRAFFGITEPSSGDVIHRDIGSLLVAEEKQLTFKVVDHNSLEAISDLNFEYNYYNLTDGTRASNRQDYISTSSYSNETGEYSIIVADFFDAKIYASLDTNRDDVVDYSENGTQPSGWNINRNVESFHNEDTIKLFPYSDSDTTDLELSDVTIRVAIIDEENNPIPGLELAINDSYNDNVISTFDNENQQYVLNPKIHKYYSLQVLVPAFIYNDVHYKSSYIDVSNNEENYYIRVNNSQYSSRFNVSNVDQIIDVTIKPKNGLDSNSFVEVLFRANELDENNAFKIFFSEPITLTEESVNVALYNSIVTTPGNASPDDLVLPGFTYFDYGLRDIEFEATLSISDTLLTLTPTADVEMNRLRFELNHVESKQDGTTEVFNNNYALDSTTKNTDEFNINDIVLDNGNHTTDDVSIVAQNTAGESSSSSNNRRSVQLIFPPSIANLKNFTIVKKLQTYNGVVSSNTESWDIVKDNVVRYNKYYYYMAAENENFDYNNHISINRGFTVNSGYYHSLNTYSSLYDDTLSNKNSLTFEYIYETSDGEIIQGQIELPVK